LNLGGGVRVSLGLGVGVGGAGCTQEAGGRCCQQQSRWFDSGGGVEGGSGRGVGERGLGWTDAARKLGEVLATAVKVGIVVLVQWCKAASQSVSSALVRLFLHEVVRL
jgi:hypothetical protein